nr:COQ9 family protein [Pararoseomonas indoligenes]
MATLPHVPRLGWTAAALEAGLRGAGEEPAAHRWLFPTGPAGAAEAWSDLADRRMEEAAAREDLAALRTPARIRRILEIRLQQTSPHRDALRRALSILALPWNARIMARTLARTADAVWAAASDTSADFSWYTRRASLAGLYAATLTFWLREPEDTAAALDFLDRRMTDLARAMRPKAAKAS